MAASGSSGSGGSTDLGLRGSTVVVTGAGSGIGATAARLLGVAGASVVLVGRREAVWSYGGQVHAGLGASARS